MTTIATEFGGSVPHSLSEYYRGGGLVPNTPTNSAIPTSGTISIGNFYGSANRVAVNLTIAGNTYNYDVFTNRGPTYSPGSSDITVTVNPGVTVGSTSVPAYAMLVPSSFSPGDTVTIVNNGVIQGMGGAGGVGGPATSPNSTENPALKGSPGSGGGNALYVNRPTVVTNNGTIAGGGGGGGGGNGVAGVNPKFFNSNRGGSGGGGGAGFNGGAGGAGGPASGGPEALPGITGSAGTSPAGGAGGPGRPIIGGNAGAGGTGGGRGAAGSGGGVSNSPNPANISRNSSPASGGGAGNYLVGNPFVTWPAFGTRQGGVS